MTPTENKAQTIAAATMNGNTALRDSPAGPRIQQALAASLVKAHQENDLDLNKLVAKEERDRDSRTR